MTSLINSNSRKNIINNKAITHNKIPKSLVISSISAFNSIDVLSKSKNEEHRRYKKNHISKDYEPILNSPISKLNDKVKKFFNQQISKQELYTVLIKNNIDPDNKKVTNILNSTDLETNKTQRSIVQKLLLTKDEKTSRYENIDQRLNSQRPVNQTLTTYEINPLQKDNSYCMRNIEKSSQKGAPLTCTNANSTQKKKFDLDKTQLNSSFSFNYKNDKHLKDRSLSTVNYNNKQLFVRSNNRDSVSLNKNMTHRDIKINFIRHSNIFPEKQNCSEILENNKHQQLRNNSLAQKYSGSIMNNYSTHKNFYSHGKQEIFKSPSGKGSKCYKNAMSEVNSNVTLKACKDIAPTQIKIVGLVGKLKVNNNNANQNTSTMSHILTWTSKKNKTNSSFLSNASKNTADSFNKTNNNGNYFYNSSKIPKKTTNNRQLNLNSSFQSFSKLKSNSICGNINIISKL